MRSGSRIATAIAFTLSLTISGSAAAQDRTLRDERGDAPPSADITSVHLRNGAHRVVTRVRVVNLASGSDITLTVNHDGPGRYILRTGGLGKGSLNFARGFREVRVTCPEWSLSRYTGARSLMVVGIPQRCFGRRAGTASST